MAWKAFRGVCGVVWLVLAGCQLQPTASPAPPGASGEYLEQSIRYLASPELEGRGVGSVGLEAAGNYVAGYFRGLGLRPAPGQKSYFQRFEATLITGLSPDSTLRAGGKIYGGGLDFTPLEFSAQGRFGGQVAFVGYGISAGEYDDYAGVDVGGKIALAMRFEPHGSEGKSRLAGAGWSEHAGLLRKAKRAAERGAAALLVVHPPEHHGAEVLRPLPRQVRQQLPIPVVQVRQRVAEELLKSAGAEDLRTFQAAIDNTFSPRSFILKRVGMEGNVALESKTYELKNVMAYRPGRGRLSKECIVIGAHYDHLGHGGFGSRSPASEEIHPGADDNASGTAAVLELARVFSQTSAPQRSLLFVAFSGEEQGLLGSQYWVDHPPLQLKRIKAMINLDMVGRVKEDELQVGGSGTSPPFEALLRQADETSPLKLELAYADGFAPSDHVPFLARRIPVLFLFSGMHADHHRPTDVPGKINYAGGAEVVDLAAGLIVALSGREDLHYAPAPARPATQPSLWQMAQDERGR